MLLPSSTVPFGVQYWEGPSATAGVDYTAATATLIFAPDQSSMPITVQVTGDRIPESVEDCLVILSNAIHAHIGTSQARKS